MTLVFFETKVSNVFYQPTAIRKDIVLPTLQFVRATDVVKHGLAGFETEVVCIIQT